MRVAPIGLYFDSPEQAAHIGAEAAALTHGHELGWLSSAAQAYLISLLAHNEDCTLSDAVSGTLAAFPTLFPTARYMGSLIDLLHLAVELAASDMIDLDAIHRLGEGWVGDETLAIAVYCALRHANDFSSGIIAAVNHRGDSDSTGAVAGNILGAYLGLTAIPSRFLEPLEWKDLLIQTADELLH